VGPGNAPCYIERSADIEKAASDIVLGKTFDNGVLCSSPNSVVIDEAISEEGRRAFQARGAHFLNQTEMDALAKVLVTAQRLPNPALVGKSAVIVAQQAGIKVPDGTRVLVAPLTGVGREHPLSIEKLCPVLSWYVVADWRAGCERCIEILRYGGMGHTMSIHSRNDDVILQFGLKKPAFRICVNTPTTHGSIGLTTGLDPAMTLGCGGWGGNITSDNISPRHLLNIKRLAYELKPPVVSAASGSTLASPVPSATSAAPGRTVPGLPKAPVAPVSRGIPTPMLADRIDAFLAARGLKPDSPPSANPSGPAVAPALPSAPNPAISPAAGTSPPMPVPRVSPAPAAEPAVRETERPLDFVCEDDVRTAMRAGRKLIVGEKTIVTPSARDLGESAKVFVYAGWPR
jgi:acetaldehyde dehydrogenase (acetylating)